MIIHYLYLLILFIVGVVGLCHFIYAQQRRQRANKVLNIDRMKDNSDRRTVTSPVERLFKRTSRVMTITDMLDGNIILKMGLAVFLFLLVYGYSSLQQESLPMDVLLVILVGIIISVIIVPGRIKASIVNRRVKKIANDLPFFIDIMAVCIQSGMTVENSINQLANSGEKVNIDIALLFQRVIARAEVSGIQSGLEILEQEVPCQEMATLCRSLGQSVRFGSSIYQVLLDLSKETRELQLLQTEESVTKLATKMTLPMILFILFPIMAIVGGPGVVRLFRTLMGIGS